MKICEEFWQQNDYVLTAAYYGNIAQTCLDCHIEVVA